MTRIGNRNSFQSNSLSNDNKKFTWGTEPLEFMKWLETSFNIGGSFLYLHAWSNKKKAWYQY